MTDPGVRREVASRIAAVRGAVVVHGGGPFIARALQEAGMESRFVRGLRVTPPESLPVVERTLTQLGKVLAQEIGGALGLTGRDSSLLVAEPLPELGAVGRVVGVNGVLLAQLLELHLVPVIACLAETGDKRGVLNVNADSAAGAVAGALSAPVVFLSDVPGVLDHPHDPHSLLRRLTEGDVRVRIGDGRIAGGMIPKVEAALEALAAGAPFAVIADGRAPEDLPAAFAGKAGTRVERA